MYIDSCAIGILCCWLLYHVCVLYASYVAYVKSVAASWCYSIAAFVNVCACHTWLNICLWIVYAGKFIFGRQSNSPQKRCWLPYFMHISPLIFQLQLLVLNHSFFFFLDSLEYFYLFYRLWYENSIFMKPHKLFSCHPCIKTPNIDLPLQ